MNDFPKFCPECGSALPEEIRFCPECGANLIAEVAEETTIIAEETTNETVETVVVEEPSTENETVAPVTETPVKPTNEKKKNNTTLGVAIILLVVVAIVVAVLYKMDIINFGNGAVKDTSTSTTIEDTSSTSESQTTETTTESTTVTTTETTTEKATVDPLSFMGKSIDELIEMYSDECESYSLEGAHYVQFYDKDGKLAPYAFIFWSDPFMEPYERVIGYTCGPKGTEFYKGLKIGDSLETFKQVTGVTDIEIYFDQEWSTYMAVKIPLDYGFTIDLEFSDHNGTEITYVEVISSY